MFPVPNKSLLVQPHSHDLPSAQLCSCSMQVKAMRGTSLSY